MVTGPAASSAVRSAGSRSIILAVVAARPAPAPRQCLPVNPRARCLTGPMPLSSAPIRPSLPHSSVTATIPPVAVSEGSAAPIWILPRVLPGVRAASTISVTLLLLPSSTVTLDNPSRTPQPHTLSAACRRSTRGNGSDQAATSVVRPSRAPNQAGGHGQFLAMRRRRRTSSSTAGTSSSGSSSIKRSSSSRCARVASMYAGSSRPACVRTVPVDGTVRTHAGLLLPAYIEAMSAQREELLRLIEELPEDEVPAVLDDVRRRLRIARNWPWPPAWFGAREGRTTDVAAWSDPFPRVERRHAAESV